MKKRKKKKHNKTLIFKEGVKMEGQYSIYDTPGEAKPCSYSWQRYIGQKVFVSDSLGQGDYIGVIVDIFPYYTTIDVEGLDYYLTGTPTTCYPVEEVEVMA